MAIDFELKEYTDMLPHWQMIKDICSGLNYKAYIRKINPTDRTRENVARNTEYQDNAVFLEIAGYTVRGLIGLAFRQEPSLEASPDMGYVLEDIDGSGTSIHQQARHVLSEVLQTGRCGLWVEYPDTGGMGPTVAEVEEAGIRATSRTVDATAVTSWATTKVGARQMLSRVVFRDSVVEEVDYEITAKPVFVELFLDAAGHYSYRTHQKNIREEWEPGPTITPTDSTGNPWREIPFLFCGSAENTPSIDHPPMLAIARLNVGHLNNSASYEDSVWICGQPQPWASGITPDDVKDMQSAGMYWGSRMLLPIPDGGSVGIEQAAPNTLAKGAMDDKIAQAVGIGAMYITPGQAPKTATEITGEREARHSVLSLASANVSSAYGKILAWMQRYNGGDAELYYDLSKEIVQPSATAQDIQAMSASWLQGALPWPDYWRYMQQIGRADPDKTAEEAREEIDSTLGGMNAGE